jgi:hypothetical protein
MPFETPCKCYITGLGVLTRPPKLSWSPRRFCEAHTIHTARKPLPSPHQWVNACRYHIVDANQQPTGQLKLRVAPADAAMLAASVAHRLVEPQAMDQAVLSFSEAAAAHPTDDLSVTDAVDDAALLVSRLPSEARREHSLRHPQLHSLQHHRVWTPPPAAPLTPTPPRVDPAG